MPSVNKGPTAILCLSAFAPLLGGCLLGQTAIADHPPTDCPILWQASGDDLIIRKGFNLVVRDQAGLSQIPLTDVNVDFTKQMVLFATLGPVRTRGIDIQIQRVWRQGNRIHTEILILRPDNTENDRFEPHSPYHLVVVPRSDLNVAEFNTSVPKGALARG